TSGGQSAYETIRQLVLMQRFYAAKVETAVAEAIAHIRQVEANLLEHYGIQMQNLDILELGPGQFCGQMTYLSRHNRVVGIDRDIRLSRVRPTECWRMWRVNGPMRTCKTLGRKVLGFDRRYAKELSRQLGLVRLPDLDVRQGDG